MSTSLVHVNPLSENRHSLSRMPKPSSVKWFWIRCSRSTPSATTLKLSMICLPSVAADRSPALLMEYRTTMDHLSPSTINVRLFAIRKLVGEARRNGMIGLEEAANLHDVPNVRQNGTRLGNWLTREQAKQLLAVPDRSTLKGKRDYVIIPLLVACALRRRELATLNIEDIQLREGRWVIIDLRGKGGRIRTVAVPMWVKQGIDAWMTAA
jgi:integrase